MQLTKFTHSCVRLEHDGHALVIDPGNLTEPEALQDADAVLVTHEHPDHVDAELLRAAQTGNPALVVHTVADVVAQLADKGVHSQPVAPGDRVSVAGFDVAVVGGRHAEIIDGLPGCANAGYVVAPPGAPTVYHPGDSVFVPDERVETLLVPAGGPWLKLREAIELMRAIRPTRAFPIHDAMFNENGQHLVDGWLGDEDGTSFARLAPGESVTL